MVIWLLLGDCAIAQKIVIPSVTLPTCPWKMDTLIPWVMEGLALVYGDESGRGESVSWLCKDISTCACFGSFCVLLMSVSDSGPWFFLQCENAQESGICLLAACRGNGTAYLQTQEWEVKKCCLKVIFKSLKKRVFVATAKDNTLICLLNDL